MRHFLPDGCTTHTDLPGGRLALCRKGAPVLLKCTPLLRDQLQLLPSRRLLPLSLLDLGSYPGLHRRGGQRV